MENSENKPQDTEANNHPKPTEDVQLNIETVTPDTEKEGLPNDQKHNHASEKVPAEASAENEDRDEKASDSVPKTDGGTGDESDSKSENEELSKEESEESNEETEEISEESEENNAESKENNVEPENDKRDEIETTSP